MESKTDAIVQQLATSVRKKIAKLAPLSPKCCIYRIPYNLREGNKSSYKPCLISIGPFHHNNKKLQPMQEHKLRYLHNFLQRNEKKMLEDYLKYIRQCESQLREYYVEVVEMSSREFNEMVLLDGCFLLEFFLLWFLDKPDESDCIFKNSSLEVAILRDILLLENQLPFFVLEGLYSIAFGDDGELVSPLVQNLGSATDSDSDSDSNGESNDGGVWSMPSFIDLCCEVLVGRKINIVEKFSSENHQILHFVDFLRTCYLPSSLRDRNDSNNHNDETWEFPPGVESLHDSGIKFQVAKKESLLDIDFSNGVLSIPRLEMEDHTESLLLNLSAFEQCHYHFDSYIVDYVVLMDILITTIKDVNILMSEGIIMNSLGNTEDLAEVFNTVFNTICKGTTYQARGYYYTKLFNHLNAYCKTPWHKWRAKLKHDYFSNPWAIISAIGAVVLVILTVVQTICTIMSMN